jgi:hypothetical protein
MTVKGMLRELQTSLAQEAAYKDINAKTKQ